MLTNKRIPILRKNLKSTKSFHVRQIVLHGTEFWPATKSDKLFLYKMNIRMLRWSMRISLFEVQANNSIREHALYGKQIDKVLLMWFDYVLKRAQMITVQTIYEIEGKRSRDGPKQRYTYTTL